MIFKNCRLKRVVLRKNMAIARVLQNYLMKSIILLSAFIFFCSQNLLAQVKGIVLDSAENTIERALVGIVVKSQPADTTFTKTNEKGEFSFENVPASDFIIIITGEGYKPAGKFIKINNTLKTINLGNVTLINSSKILSEILIKSPPIIVKEDTIEYRADAFKVKENAVVEDLLKKLPGVQVDRNGNIKAQGKTVTKVKVNGKDFFGGDTKTVTKELPANIVEKVQIIDDYGEQAALTGIKDGEPQKIINIQLKKDKNTGYFGRATVGAGDKGRYQASLNGNYFKNNQQISLFTNSNNTSQSLFNFGGGSRSPANMVRSGQEAVNTTANTGTLNTAGNGDLLQSGASGADGITTLNSIGINYRDQWSKKITVYGSYSYSHKNNSGYKIISQQNIFSSGIFFNNQNNNFLSQGNNHRVFFNVEFTIDSFNYLKISPNFSYTSGIATSNTLFDYFTAAKGKISEGYNNNITGTNSPNFSASVLYNHKFKKRGRNFSMNITGGTSQSNTVQDSKNNTIKYVSPLNTSNLFLFNNQKNENYNYGLRLTYTEPLSKKKFLDLALSNTLFYTKNNKLVYDIDPSTGIKIMSGGLSNAYENNFFTNRANISIRTTQKKYNYTAGISIQPVNLKGNSITKDSSYQPVKRINIFPVARFAYNFSKAKSLSLNYHGDAQQPGFSQLQDVFDSSNRQYQTRGNPHLKPSINHSLNIFYTDFNFVSGRVLFSSLAFSKIQNQIVYNTIQLGNSGTQLTVPQNINGYYNVSGFYNISKPYKNRMYVAGLSGNLNYNHNINLVDSIKNTGNNWVASQGFTFEFNYKEWLEFGIGANYNLNLVSYKNSIASAGNLKNDQYNSWGLTSNIVIDIPKNWILKSDLEYTTNKGLTGGVGKNVAIVNASLERQLFKKKNGILRFQGFDLLNQNSNISRTINSNSITDSRITKLNRYFMLSFTYRLQKFSGKKSQQKITPSRFPAAK